MNLTWLNEQGLERLPEFLTALAMGLLIGLERERNPSAKAGLRTFALVALAGACIASLSELFNSPSLIGVGLAAVALTLIMAYYPHQEGESDLDPGTTTIAAIIICYLLGVMATTTYSRLAVIIAVSATSLLYFKTEMRGVAIKLERRDLVCILQFAVVTFVIFPLLPDRPLGPYGALNLHHIWLMVVLISAISLAGYIALRFIRREHGSVLLGLFGGMVSSTATTLAYSRYAKKEIALIELSATVIVTANLVLLVRLTILSAIVAPESLVTLGPVMAAGLVAGTISYVIGQRNTIARHGLNIPEVKNPMELRTAVGFAGLYAGALVLTAWLSNIAGSEGVYLAALIAGLTDVDAITLSGLRLYNSNNLSALQVSTSVVLAVLANSVFKLGIVRLVGGPELFRRCIFPLLAVLVAATLALWCFK